MIDEDSISVVITASKEIENEALERGDDGAKIHPKSRKYTIYTVFVRNVTTGGKCVVRRRYSDFYKLRKELMELVSWGHCGFCEQYLQQIAKYPFPRRRLLRSSRDAVVKERMDSLGLFLRHMLLCLMARTFENCSQAGANIESCIMKSFLQMEQTEKLFPTVASKQRPIEILQAMEEKRQQQIKAAGLRTKNLAYTTLSDQSDQPGLSRNQRQVGTDTCHLCLQKWTHCYCNSDQDSVYPVHIPRANQLVDAPASERPSISMADSDASRCSHCESVWNRCYCCQQVSPTASSQLSLPSTSPDEKLHAVVQDLGAAEAIKDLVHEASRAETIDQVAQAQAKVVHSLPPTTPAKIKAEVVDLVTSTMYKGFGVKHETNCIEQYAVRRQLVVKDQNLVFFKNKVATIATSNLFVGGKVDGRTDKSD
ncbi:hypothetical protein PsorP6_008810 [Peronosclerospora sorghi]|uniref:Uncharacterized protein n=1 Tax=Peronosclerospora sorghi TaxID=230839 RepID=A0ACC0VY17_9STRA|nr:hypothetical protein PsorP6_008810 [Peronosclerospora sorghi]